MIKRRNRFAVSCSIASLTRYPFISFTACAANLKTLRGSARVTARLLAENPPDFAVLGIGEKWSSCLHRSPVLQFHRSRAVKVVELDEVCREQQVHDGAFETIDEVPRQAMSLTIPTIMARPKLFAIVPGAAKQQP